MTLESQTFEQSIDTSIATHDRTIDELYEQFAAGQNQKNDSYHMKSDWEYSPDKKKRQTKALFENPIWNTSNEMPAEELQQQLANYTNVLVNIFNTNRQFTFAEVATNKDYRELLFCRDILRLYIQNNGIINILAYRKVLISLHLASAYDEQLIEAVNTIRTLTGNED